MPGTTASPAATARSPSVVSARAKRGAAFGAGGVEPSTASSVSDAESRPPERPSNRGSVSRMRSACVIHPTSNSLPRMRVADTALCASRSVGALGWRRIAEVRSSDGVLRRSATRSEMSARCALSDSRPAAPFAWKTRREWPSIARACSGSSPNMVDMTSSGTARA